MAKISLTDAQYFSLDERINIIAELFWKLGITVCDTAGCFKSINEIMWELHKKWSLCLSIDESTAIDAAIRFIDSIPSEYYFELLSHCFHTNASLRNDFAMDFADSRRLYEAKIANYNMVKWADSPDDISYRTEIIQPF